LGQRAVAHVVMNRSRDARFPRRLCDVVWQDRGPLGEDCQFTWTCDGLSDLPKDARSWQESLEVTKQAYEGKSEDPTGGALWFHADSVDPVWRPAMEPGQPIGHHIFYRGQGGPLTAALQVKSSGARAPQADAATIALIMKVLNGHAASLPDLTIEVKYSMRAKNLAVRLNAWTFREGELPAPDVRVEAITRHGVVLSYRNGQFRRLLPATYDPAQAAVAAAADAR